MSVIGNLLKSVTSLLGVSQKINIPKAEVPAAPAPTSRTSTGTNITIGSQSGASRISGGGAQDIGQQVDILGGLGVGGLRI